MDLLQVDAMSATFTLKDVVYIVVGVASALAFYWKMVLKHKEMDTKIERLDQDVDKNEAVMFKKFTGIHTRFEKTEENNKSELDTINKEINEVKIGISTMNGKLDILINK